MNQVMKQDECDKLLDQDWGRKEFKWSDILDLARKQVFG